MPRIDGYELTPIHPLISIDHIVTVHYFEYSKNYIFEGEKHNFWEFLYVDKGCINVKANDTMFSLSKGQIIFHEPNEWHTVVANGQTAPNLVVIAFTCDSPAMHYFKKRILSIDHHLYTYLGKIINAAHTLFTNNLNDPLLKKLDKRFIEPTPSEHYITSYLELFLVEILEHHERYEKDVKVSTSIHEYMKEEKLAIVINFLQENLHQNLTLDDICQNTLLSRSSLQKLFKEGTGHSVMDYFKEMKIQEIKHLIREENHNFTEIAEILGYSSIHYLSRTFKANTGMTLSEYASSVKALLDN